MRFDVWMSIENSVRNYILENYLFTDDQSELTNDVSLLERGIIDSTGIMELVLFIEEAFGIKIDDDEMVPENLDSVDNIISFIKGKNSN